MDDADPLFRTYSSDPEVARYVRWTPAPSVDRVREFLESVISDWASDSAETYQWVIADLDSDEPLGMFSLRIDDHGAMIGYAISRSHWGKGLVPEAARAVTKEALSDPSIYRIWAICDVENAASARVMEKIGMKREGTLRRFIVHPNISDEPRDVLMYALVRDELAR